MQTPLHPSIQLAAHTFRLVQSNSARFGNGEPLVDKVSVTRSSRLSGLDMMEHEPYGPHLDVAAKAAPPSLTIHFLREISKLVADRSPSQAPDVGFWETKLNRIVDDFVRHRPGSTGCVTSWRRYGATRNVKVQLKREVGVQPQLVSDTLVAVAKKMVRDGGSPTFAGIDFERVPQKLQIPKVKAKRVSTLRGSTPCSLLPPISLSAFTRRC